MRFSWLFKNIKRKLSIAAGCGLMFLSAGILINRFEILPSSSRNQAEYIVNHGTNQQNSPEAATAEQKDGSIVLRP